MKKTLRYKIQEEDCLNQTLTVKDVLRRFLHLQKREISRLKWDGKILCNNTQVYVTKKVMAGDVIEVEFEETTSSDEFLSSDTSQIDIIYEDQDVVVLNKPAGIVLHPVHGHLDDSLGSQLMTYYKKQGQAFTIRPIGRLDKNVSGLVMFAKNQPAARRLSIQQDQKTFLKTYLAIVKGELEETSSTINKPIQKEEGKKQRVIHEDGKPSITHYDVVEKRIYQNQMYSVVEVQIETGRTHQIRLHFASIGHPLLNDDLYGTVLNEFNQVGLMCYKMMFQTPFSNEDIRLNAPLCKDFQYFLDHSIPAIAN